MARLSTMHRWWRLSLVFAFAMGAYLAWSPVISTAQMSAEEHASHHPGMAQPPAGSPAPSSPPGPAAVGGPPAGMADMGKMMESMGKVPAKDLYPTLMNLPKLTPDQRVEVEVQARKRMADGASTMAQAAGKLNTATTGENYSEMHSAATDLQQGLSDFDNSLAALQALKEGQAPQQVALRWFKTEMNLIPVAGHTAAAPTIFGLSFFHFFVMGALIAFVVVMIWMYFFKMRRAASLIHQLAGGTVAPSTTAPPAASSPKAGSPSPSGPKPAPPAAVPAKAAAPAATTPPPAAPEGPVSSGWKGILRVNRIFVETPNVKTFRLTAVGGGPIPFTYLPGQFLTIAATLDGKRVQRSYTMASSPTQRYYCEVTIKREEHGLESRYLHDGLQEGQLLEAAGPTGKFIFTGAEAKSVVLIGGGVGITPLMSTLRYLTDTAWGGDIFFLYTCRHVCDFIFRDELERLCARHPKLHLLVTISQPNEESWSGRTGHLTKELIAQSVPDIATRRVHVCGPDRMMKAIQGALLELDVPAAQVKTEAFGAGQKAPAEPLETPFDAAAKATPEAATKLPADAEKNAPGEAAAKPAAEAPSDAQPVAAEAPAAAAAKVPAKGDTKAPAEVAEKAPPAATNAAPAAAAVSVTFKKSGKNAPLPPDKSILEASEDVGVNIDFECRVGTCGTCKVKLLTGNVTMEVEDGLDPGDKEKNIILACQSKSAADVIVDAYVPRAQVQNAGPTGL